MGKEKRRRIVQDEIKDEMKQDFAFGPDNVSLNRPKSMDTIKTRLLEDIT